MRKFAAGLVLFILAALPLLTWAGDTKTPTTFTKKDVAQMVKNIHTLSRSTTTVINELALTYKDSFVGAGIYFDRELVSFIEGKVVEKLTVESFEPDSAEKAGLRKGDVVLKVNGFDIKNYDEFRLVVGTSNEDYVGTSVTVTVRRGLEKLDVEVPRVLLWRGQPQLVYELYQKIFALRLDTLEFESRGFDVVVTLSSDERYTADHAGIKALLKEMEELDKRLDNLWDGLTNLRKTAEAEAAATRTKVKSRGFLGIF